MTLLNDERFSLKINSIRLKCFQIENILIVNKFNEIEFQNVFIFLSKTLKLFIIFYADLSF